MMIPWQVGLIPGFLLVDDLGWLNTFMAYIIPALPKAFIVFFLVQYLSSIPDELIEAARIDGAREWTIYFRIVLPTKPAMIAMMILPQLVMEHFLWPLIITQSQDMANCSSTCAPQKLRGWKIGTQGVIMAAALLVSIANNHSTSSPSAFHSRYRTFGN